MPAFGTVTIPARTSQRLEINSPDGFMSDPPGDLWWLGLHSWWQQKVPASVTRATAIIVNPLVRMPWLLHTPDGATLQPGDVGYPTWITDPMLLNGSSGGPNTGRFPMLDRLDRFDFWARWIRDAMWLGTGAIAYEPDSAGQPLAGTLQLIDPTRLWRSDDGWAIETRGQLLDIDDAGMIPELGLQLLVLRHSLPGGVFGRHRDQLELAARISAYASETLDSDVPSGVLSTEQPITQTQAEQTRTEWENTQRRRRIAVLGNGARYQPVAISPVDAELLGMARLSNEQVAHMFELPAWHLDASTNSSTYTNALDWRQDLVDGPEASWSARLEETLGSVLGWRTTLEVDFTKYTKPMTEGTPGGTPNPA